MSSSSGAKAPGVYSSPDDAPHAPSAIAARTSCSMRANSSAVAGRSSPPTTTSRIVPSPTIDATFTDGWSRSSAVHSCAKVANCRRESSSFPSPVARGRARRTVLADDDRRDALADQRFRARIAPERAVAVRVNVDESWRNGASPRVNLYRAAIIGAARRRVIRPPVITTSSSFPAVPSAVEDGAVSDDDVGVGARARSSEGAAIIAAAPDVVRRKSRREVIPEIVSDVRGPQ